MNNKNSFENSIFYKQNEKINKNMWKPYTIALIISFMVLFIEGIK